MSEEALINCAELKNIINSHSGWKPEQKTDKLWNFKDQLKLTKRSIYKISVFTLWEFINAYLDFCLQRPERWEKSSAGNSQSEFSYFSYK